MKDLNEVAGYETPAVEDIPEARERRPKKDEEEDFEECEGCGGDVAITSTNEGTLSYIPRGGLVNILENEEECPVCGGALIDRETFTSQDGDGEFTPAPTVMCRVCGESLANGVRLVNDEDRGQIHETCIDSGARVIA